MSPNRDHRPDGVVFIAECPEHGLHGERRTCFTCGGPVRQVAMRRCEPPAPRAGTYVCTICSRASSRPFPIDEHGHHTDPQANRCSGLTHYRPDGWVSISTAQQHDDGTWGPAQPLGPQGAVANAGIDAAPSDDDLAGAIWSNLPALAGCDDEMKEIALVRDALAAARRDLAGDFIHPDSPVHPDNGPAKVEPPHIGMTPNDHCECDVCTAAKLDPVTKRELPPGTGHAPAGKDGFC
ncbi:unannotated protein [freshwater metagenome]|uniref:Unannotated protein n=1 Tax=freshwater metagenome TaxID=449393 RepID=A0A6J7GDM2_9ZZZZ|nr:hypothetical protein [Actinomycetota bacterium]